MLVNLYGLNKKLYENKTIFKFLKLSNKTNLIAHDRLPKLLIVILYREYE